MRMMQALKPHRYANVQRQPGEHFEVRNADVRLMKALGWQTEAPALDAPAPIVAAPAAPKAKRTYTRRVVQAEAAVNAPAAPAATEAPAEGASEPEPEPEPVPVPVPRTYLRRDLVAEGE